VNAYTSRTETVYNISAVPLVRESFIDSVLLVLHDWSCDISCEQDALDAERGVISEEWRLRDNQRYRMNCRQTELIYALTGLMPVKSGEINICGEDVTNANVRMKSNLLSHIPEDRHKHGLVLDFDMAANMILRRYREKKYQHAHMLQNDAIRDYGKGIIERCDVVCGRGVDTIVGRMSGGNQQKAIIGRELDMNRPLIIAVYPTRGVDVGAIENIHKNLINERDSGKAVLVASVELSEVMGLSDRILVMFEGEIVGELDPKKTSFEEIGLYMSGAKNDKKEVMDNEG